MSNQNEDDLRDLAADAVATLRNLGADDDAIRHRLAQATVLHAVAASDDLVAIIGRIASSGKVWADDLERLSKLTGQTFRIAEDEPARQINVSSASDPELVSKLVSERLTRWRDTPSTTPEIGVGADRVTDSKPPRLRYFELPMQTAGIYTEIPFILVVDRCPDDLAESVRGMGNALKKATGAKGVVAIRQEVDLDG